MNQALQTTDAAELIVSLIRQGDPQGEELLYSILSRGMKFLAIQKLGQEDGLECFHDTMVILLSRLREGALQEPAALFGYARTILLRGVTDQFEKRRRFSIADDFDSVAFAVPDQRLTADQALEADQRLTAMRKGLLALRPKEREILTRFYLHEESAEAIQQEMNLTATQFRLLKSRSKQKLEQVTANTVPTAKSNPTTNIFPGNLGSPLPATTPSLW